MSGSHFYLTLPSNASMDVFPDNKTTGYRVQLPQNINLEGDWEVGLYSISYSNTWYTLRNHQNHIYCSTDGHSFMYSATVDYGYNASMPDLIKSINAGIKKELGNSKISFSFNPQTEKVSVTPAPKSIWKVIGKWVCTPLLILTPGTRLETIPASHYVY